MHLLTRQEREFREKMRGRYPACAKWYALMVYCGREHQVRDRILTDFANDGVEEVLLPELRANGRNPTRKRKPRELLFPSYVFLRCRMSDVTYMRVTGYDGVFSILGRAFRIPTIIDDAEMQRLRAVLKTYPLPTVSPRLNVGAEAVVTQGLLEGMRGRVVESNAHYVKLETRFSFFEDGTSIIVSIPYADVRLEETGMFGSQ